MAAAPRKRVSELRFEEHRELLEPLIAAVAELGRVPEVEEFAGATEIVERFGSLKRAFALIRRVTGDEEWDEIRQRRTEDLLVYLALARSVKLNLRTRELDCWDYLRSDNPPILHRKETFLPVDHPMREKFARLTRQEEQHGLLDETATIGTRNGWKTRLEERGFELRGHRLVKKRT